MLVNFSLHCILAEFAYGGFCIFQRTKNVHLQNSNQVWVICSFENVYHKFTKKVLKINIENLVNVVI